MSDKLLFQTCDEQEKFSRLARLTEPIHAAYASACGADFDLFIGQRDATLNGIWNRHALFLEAFAQGYRKVVYLDVDTLVVDTHTSIFAGTDDEVPLQLLRLRHLREPLPWSGGALYHGGVIVANNTPEAVAAFQFVWDHRHATPPDHHLADFHDQNWLWDYLLPRPAIAGELSPRFNWMLGPSAPVIVGWHGLGHRERYKLMRDAMAHYPEPAQ